MQTSAETFQPENPRTLTRETSNDDHKSNKHKNLAIYQTKMTIGEKKKRNKCRIVILGLSGKRRQRSNSTAM